MSSLRSVPEAPDHHQPRAEAEAAVVAALLASDAGAAGNNIIGISAAGGKEARMGKRLGVVGQGGIGKTVLAATVARLPAVAERFPGGVVWLAVTQEPNLLLLLEQLARHFAEKPGAVPMGTFATADEGKLRLRERLEHEAVLLVLDDIWEAKHAAALDVVGKRGRILVTTRNRQVLDELGALPWCPGDARHAPGG